MKKSFYKIGLFSCVLVASGCVSDQSKIRQNVGVPEALIDTSSEVVTVKLTSKESLSKLSGLISRDVPARAELRCSLGSVKCSQAKAIFVSKSIPVSIGNQKENGVAIFYDRTIVRDCDPHYVDNMHDGIGAVTNHPAFGCATASNIVQMVSDRKQFTSPSLMDLPDAEKGVQTYNSYLKPPVPPSDSSSSSSSGASSSSK